MGRRLATVLIAVGAATIGACGSDDTQNGRTVDSDARVQDGGSVDANVKVAPSELVTVPAIVGACTDDAAIVAKEVSLTLANDLPQGLVIEQDPPAGATARSGTALNVTIVPNSVCTR